MISYKKQKNILWLWVQQKFSYVGCEKQQAIKKKMENCISLKLKIFLSQRTSLRKLKSKSVYIKSNKRHTSRI